MKQISITTPRFNILLLVLLMFTSSSAFTQSSFKDRNVYIQGGIVRTDTTKKRICLLFTAHEYADGTDTILKILKKEQLTASFFFTGKFMTTYPDVVKRIKAHQHFVGSHGFEHLLYCDWTKRDSTLITKEAFIKDLQKSYETMAALGIDKKEATFFEPPFEWYNTETAKWANELGLHIVQFTSGNYSNADYTTPDMKNYKSSQEIMNRILKVEQEGALKGALLLFHLGTSPLRTDKFYNNGLSELIKILGKKGYSFISLKEATQLTD